MSFENGNWLTARDNGIDLGNQTCRVVWSDNTGTDVAYIVDRSDDDNGNKVALAVAALPHMLRVMRIAVRELPHGPVRTHLAVVLAAATGVKRSDQLIRDTKAIPA